MIFNSLFPNMKTRNCRFCLSVQKKKKTTFDYSFKKKCFKKVIKSKILIDMIYVVHLYIFHNQQLGFKCYKFRYLYICYPLKNEHFLWMKWNIWELFFFFFLQCVGFRVLDQSIKAMKLDDMEMWSLPRKKGNMPK